jgi:hypothetical protein
VCAPAVSGSTYTLTTPLPLTAGAHTIWPDGGCSLGGFADPCGAGGENDFDFIAITLVSAQTSTTRNFNQRRHLGDTDDPDNNYSGVYPDRPDATTLSLGFTLESARVLTQVRFHRVREIAAIRLSSPTVVIDDGTAGEVTVGALTNATLLPLGASVTLAAGAHTITVDSGVELVDRDDFSWDDLELLFTPVSGSVPGQYNAVDPAADAVTGSITTKTAGTAFQLDLVALLNGAVFASYTGTVTVEIVNAASATGSCTSWPQAANLGSVTFTAGDAGRKTVSITYADALANARVRINDTVNAVASCSADNFAIKPAGFAGITASHADATTPGTAVALATAGFSAATQPVHKAGRSFTVQAHARNSSGAVTTAYAGSPALNASATIAGMGAVLGSASASGWTYPSAGYIRSDAAQYDEVGAVTLELVDTTFADVDADDTPALADRQIGPSTFSVGRFIPDHFTFVEVVPAEFAAGCTGFTYVGQPFAFDGGATPSARITAVSSGGAPTRNYTDADLYKIALHPSGTALPQSTYAATAGTFNTALVPNPDNTFVKETNGASLLTLIVPSPGYAFTRAAPSAPFNAEITITLAFTEGDGVTFGTTPGRFGDPAAGGIPFASGSNQVRFGRLTIANAQGSELLPLSVPVQAEYVPASGGIGFTRNLSDTCTPLLLTHFTLTGSLAGLPDPPADVTPTLSGPASGLWTLTLGAPPGGDTGSVGIEAVIGASLPWLQTEDTDLDTLYNNNPRAIATFGLSSGSQRRIFQREIIGY